MNMTIDELSDWIRDFNEYYAEELQRAKNNKR